MFNTPQGKVHERAMYRRALVYVERGLYFLHLFSGTVIGLPVDYSREVTISALQHYSFIPFTGARTIWQY